MEKIGTNAYLDYVLEKLEPVGNISLRAIFGGYGIYFRHTMFALVAYDELFFKVDENNIADYKNVGNSPFVYTGKHMPDTLSYWRLPENILNNTKELHLWVKKACKASLLKGKR